MRGKDLLVLLNGRGFKMSQSTLYSALSSEKFSYQACRPYNPRRDEDLVRQWKDDFENVFTQVSQDHSSKEISVFVQYETRFGQKGTTSKQWAPVGKRPNRPVQDEYGNGYIFGAVCPDSGHKHFLVSTDLCIDFMQYFLKTFSRSLGRGVHALLVLDNASWHTSPKLKIPKNITLHFLPAYSPDLNPIENLWKFIKSNFLCNKWIKGGKQILKAGIDAVKKLTPEMIKSVCARNYGMT